MAVLAATARLLGKLAFGVFNGLADRFTVGNLGLADGRFNVELAAHTVDKNFKVKFAHARDDGLAGFFVRAHAEGRVFLSETVEGKRHLFLVSLGLGLDSLRDHGFRELHAFEDDRSVKSAERVARRNGLQAHRSSDVARFDHLDFLTLIGVHLEQTADAFLVVLDGVENGVAGVEDAGINAKERELADVRVSHDLEGKRGERSIVARFAGDFLVVQVEARNRRNVGRSRQELHDGVEHALHALVLEGGAAKHRLDFAGDGALAKTLDGFLFGKGAFLEVLVHELFVRFGSGFDHLLAPFVGGVDELSGDVFVGELHALRSFVPNDRLHLEKVNHAGKGVFSADRNNDGHRMRLEALLHLVVDLEEVGAGTVHLVDERETGHMVLVRLTPHRFGLRLDAAHGAIHHAGAVEDAHRTFHFNREVDVARGVDDVQAIRFPLHLHAAPEAGRGSGRNGDAAFLFLLHPVHRRSAVMHFADLVVDARVEQDTFSRGGLARVNVGRNTDIAIARNRSLTSHLRFLSKFAARTPSDGAPCGG